MKGDEQVCQLAQSSYLKDLKYLNITNCKFTEIALQEVMSSKNMRSVQILVARDNKITEIEGPFGDLEDASEKQIKKGVMKLQVLDVRDNRLTKIVQSKAANFLKDTVVVMWNNPFEDSIRDEITQPRHIKTTSTDLVEEDFAQTPNPLHMFTSRRRGFLDL